MKTFEDYRDETQECYKNYDAFKDKSGEVCYIPENAESLDDAFNYSDLRDEVKLFIQVNPNYLTEHETTIDAIVDNMFTSLSWEFPSTFLEQLDY